MDAVPHRCAGTKRDGTPCGRRLFDMSPDGLQDGAQIQIKCPWCNHMNVVVGEARVRA